MKIDALLNALEREIGKKSKMFFKGDYTVELKIISEIRVVVNQELDSARMIEDNRTTILKSADIAAKQIISDAKAKSAQMLSESEFVQTAKVQADEILRTAVSKQNELMQNFATYLDTKLSECENGLVSVLDEVRRDRERIKNG